MPIGAMGYVMLASTAASAGASIYGASRASSAAQEAAGMQVDAANRGAELAYKASSEALDFQKQQWASAQSAMQPYVQAGQGAVSKLSHLLGVAGVSPTNWTAQPVTPSGANAGAPDTLATRLAAQPVAYTGVAGSGPVSSTAGNTWNDPVAGRSRADTTGGLPTGGRLSDMSASERAERRADRGSRTGTGTGVTIPATGNAAKTTYDARNSALVKVQAADGSTTDVPEEYVEYFKALGYKVVSNG